MEASVVWKESTQKIFWGVIVIAIAGIVNVLYDYVSYGVSIFEFVAKYLPSNNNGLGAFFTSIRTYKKGKNSITSVAFYRFEEMNR